MSIGSNLPTFRKIWIPFPRKLGRHVRFSPGGKDASSPEAVKLISPFIGARFIAGNISNWEELFPDSASALDGIDADEIKVVAVDFDSDGLPKVKAEAYFLIPVVPSFEKVDLQEWQDANDLLSSAVVFYWKIPEGMGADELDLTEGGNLGKECSLCEK